MKTRFLLLCLLMTNLLSAQIEFAPIGAVWTYDYARHQERGRELIACIGDTMINGESARVLTITRTYIDLTQPEDTLVRIFENKYIRQSGDTVFLYHNDAFRMIYNFGAEANDHATIAWGDFPWSPTTSISVISVSDTTINGEDLRVLEVWIGCNIIDYSSGYQTTWIEGMGALDGHLFYYSDHDCDGLGIFQMEVTRFHLRCYSVNGEVIYTSFSGVDCDVLTRTGGPHLRETALTVFPNPAQDYFYVNLDEYGNNGSHQGIKIILYEASGRKIAEQAPGDSPTLFNVSQYPAGLYYLQVIDYERIYGKLLVIGN